MRTIAVVLAIALPLLLIVGISYNAGRASVLDGRICIDVEGEESGPNLARHAIYGDRDPYAPQVREGWIDPAWTVGEISLVDYTGYVLNAEPQPIDTQLHAFLTPEWRR